MHHRFYSHQCLKLSFYFVHSQGALPIKLCTRDMLHAPIQYIAIINGSKNVHTPGAHLLKSCTRLWKCARRVQGAPLISDTACMCKIFKVNCKKVICTTYLIPMVTKGRASNLQISIISYHEDFFGEKYI